MKIVAVISCSRRDEPAALLARAALEAASDAGAETEEIFLADYHIENCRRCMTCMATGRCEVADDAMALRDRLYESDGIILAAPTIGAQPDPRLTNFLVERIGRYSDYTSAFGGKYFAAISTGFGSGAESVAKRLAGMHAVGLFSRAYSSGHLGERLVPGEPAVSPRAMDHARRVGLRLAVDIWSRRTFPLQFIVQRLGYRRRTRQWVAREIQRKRDGALRAVHENLSDRGLLTA